MYQLYKSLSDSVQPISETSLEVLTLCSLSPESSNHTNRRLGCTDTELTGGILIRPDSYPVNNSQLPTNLE